MPGTHHVPEPDAGRLDLPRTAPSTQLLDQLVQLTEPRRAEGLALREQSAGHVDRDASLERRRTAAQQGALFAPRTQAEVGVRDEFGRRVGVLALVVRLVRCAG
jgi:hypothetical protein